MSARSRKKPDAPILIVDSDVLRRIRQHARSEIKTEVCGILIGREDVDGNLRIDACIPGVNAAQGGAHVTFTQDTWEHIYKIKDAEYPDARILGWYHSHPGFGVFLSDHDTFIHENFFSAPQQVAWVYDPHTDEEGCFGWVDGRLERLSQLAISDSRGGEEAGETGKPMSTRLQPEDLDVHVKERPAQYRRNDQEPPWLRWTTNILLVLSVFACGFMVSWYLFPRVMIMRVPVDPQTGMVLPVDPQTGRVIGGSVPANPSLDQPPQQPHPPAVSGTTDSSSNPAGTAARDNVQPKQ